MRYRTIFLAGVAVGFVLGARAGRERYEQIARMARRAADSPAVQQAAAAAQAQAAGVAKAAKDRVGERVPRVADAARSRFGGMTGSDGEPEGDGAGADGQSYSSPHNRRRGSG